jgi:hypothetical protein
MARIALFRKSKASRPKISPEKLGKYALYTIALLEARKGQQSLLTAALLALSNELIVEIFGYLACDIGRKSANYIPLSATSGDIKKFYNTTGCLSVVAKELLTQLPREFTVKVPATGTKVHIWPARDFGKLALDQVLQNSIVHGGYGFNYHNDLGYPKDLLPMKGHIRTLSLKVDVEKYNFTHLCQTIIHLPGLKAAAPRLRELHVQVEDLNYPRIGLHFTEHIRPERMEEELLPLLKVLREQVNVKWRYIYWRGRGSVTPAGVRGREMSVEELGREVVAFAGMEVRVR